MEWKELNLIGGSNSKDADAYIIIMIMTLIVLEMKIMIHTIYRVSHKNRAPRFELRFFRMKSLFLSAYLFLPKKEFIIVNENIQHYIRSVIIRKDGRMFKHEV